MRKTSMWFLLILGLTHTKLHLASVQNELDKVNGLHLILHGTDPYLTWELLNPSGIVAGYKIMWQSNEEKHEMIMPFLHEEILLKNWTGLPCSKEFSVTVTPYNIDFDPVGSEETKTFSWHDMVINISLSNEKSAIHASWSVTCPSKSIKKFYVTWRSEERGYERACVYPGTAVNTSNPLECFGDPPHQCSHYHVKIQPVDSSAGDVGVSAESSMHTQLETFHSVLDLQHLELDSDSVTLTWRKPRPQCPITGYIISYSGTALWGEQKRHEGSVRVVETRLSGKKNASNRGVQVDLVHYGKDTTAGVIRNLIPYSIYEICVSDTSEKNNTRSCIKIETKEIKPDAPILLSANEVNKTSLNVTWNFSPNIKGILKGFVVRWNIDTEAIGTAMVSEESYTIVGLELCENYIITVAAATGAGEGESVRTSGATADYGCKTSHTLSIIVMLLTIAAIIVLLACAWTRRHKLFPQQNKNILRKSATVTSMLPAIHFSELGSAENDDMSDGVDEDESEVREVSWMSGQQITTSVQNLTNNSEMNTYNQHNVQDHRIGSETNMDGWRHFRKYTLKADPTKVFLLHTGLNRDGVDDFLSVIWEQDVRIIVMLENCIQYWPASTTTEEKWTSFIIEAKEEETPWKNYTLRIVTLKKGAESKSVKQFHLNDYSALGVPTSKEVISEMVSTVHEALNPGPCNIVVQISSREDLMNSFIGLFDVMVEEKKGPQKIRIRPGPLLRRKTSPSLM